MKQRNPIYYCLVILTVLVIQCLSLVQVMAEQEQEAAAANNVQGDEPAPDTGSSSYEKSHRTAKKEWYLSKVKIGNFELPVDYATLAIGIISAYVLYNGLFSDGGASKVSCTASHILISDHEDATKEKMEELKKNIGSDRESFTKCAMEHSSCPSKDKGGLLGTFPPGAMVPAFDKCCFDPATPINTTVGPVHTHFGYHLIYIHERKLPEQ